MTDGVNMNTAFGMLKTTNNKKDLQNDFKNRFENVFQSTKKEDFSAKMQDSYNFSKEDADMVWNILDEINSNNLEDSMFDDVLSLLN